MIESEVANEWIAVGKEKGRVEEAVTLLIAVLEAKFGQISQEVETKIRATSDLENLHTWVAAAAKAATLDEFRAAVGL